MNAYPEKDELEKWANKSFVASCQMIYGAKYKDRMPEFMDGINTLLQNESWGVRGKVKKAAARIIDRFYQLHPPPSKYARYPNVPEMVKRHVAQRVKNLLGSATLFLKGYIDPEGELVPYAHPAIKELIHVLVFSRKASKRPLASEDLDAFNPIPIPLMAYACTALLNCIEEYRTGEHVKKEFSGADYANYYKVLIKNLKKMVTSSMQGETLRIIREDIYETGCDLLDKSAFDENQRPPAPFIPSDEEPEVIEE